jgi:hypothetical protein
MRWRRVLARCTLAMLVLVPALVSITIAPVPWWFIPSAFAVGVLVAWLMVDWIPDNWNANE